MNRGLKVFGLFGLILLILSILGPLGVTTVKISLWMRSIGAAVLFVYVSIATDYRFKNGN